jgi:hypothetical protein
MNFLQRQKPTWIPAAEKKGSQEGNAMSNTPRIPDDPDPSFPEQLRRLQRQIDQLTRELDYYKEREQAADTADAKAEAAEEERQRKRERKALIAQEALNRARADAIRAIAKLLPQAVQQAKAGKPALLRMILRATR